MHFKTPKGTELPFLNLKGKQYLQVAHRLVWFREEHPTWTIQTEVLKFDEKMAMVKATISDETGRVLSTAHKIEHNAHFQDYTEKGEAGAVGRALAFIGYGTQFAQELEESVERPSDSPLPSRAPQSPTRAAKPDSAPLEGKELEAAISYAKEAMIKADVKESDIGPIDVKTRGDVKAIIARIQQIKSVK